MKTMNIKKIWLACLVLATATSCINSDEYNVPDLSGQCQEIPVTAQVSDLTALATPGGLDQYLNPGVIEAYVTSSDEGGNFYKAISFVSVDGAIGFSMPIDDYNLYTKFEPGRKVYINIQDLWYTTKFDALYLGSYYDGDTPADNTDDQVGRIALTDYRKIIKASCTSINEDEIVNHITIAQAKNDSYLNKLIEFDNVQFTAASEGKKYFDASLNDLGGATNHEITDEYGNKIIVRFSSFALFAGKTVPFKNGKIRGVLTKFCQASGACDYQFMVRTEDDIQFDGDILTIDTTPPIVGNAIVYSGSFTENFESYPTTVPANRTFPKYVNDPVVGTRYWQNTLFSGNRYIQMSSFGGTAEDNRVLFFIPVDMSAANTFAFQSKAGFTTGSVLKVYYTTDYVPGTNVNNATLVDITSSFTISAGLTGGYPTTFTNSGTYSIPASITGNGFFVFEYVGSGLTGMTTTMQIDNVVVN